MVMDIEDLISPEEEWALVAVLQELAAAQTNHPDFVNAHEGFAVLLEEVDELWDVVKLNPKKHPERRARLMAEAKQVAAMALRFMIDLGKPPQETLGHPSLSPSAEQDLMLDLAKRAAWFTGP